MPLFVCDACNVIENTATCLFWSTLGTDKQALCSQCDPQIGKWHGLFPRDQWDGKTEMYNRKIKENPMPGLDRNKIEFHQVSRIHRDEIKAAKFDIIKAQKESMARELGERILGEKGCHMAPQDNGFMDLEMHYYVFTPAELSAYVKAQMSA